MRSKHFFISLCVVVAMMIFMTGQSLAGGGMEGVPTEGGSVQGPAVWASIVLNCNADGNIDTVALRAKRIVECNVETQSLMGPILVTWACPSSAGDIVNLYLSTTTLFGKVGPVITKVKNFNDGDGSGIVSFDAQMQYWVPDTN